ncbi:hypothetical protein JW756_01865 [Candidatus Woesearchaeota archaeon]|nr:hypothetical protein [Candidatus Woesearchaeota archaeon]
MAVESKTLENISLWYKYKTEVWTKETPQTATVHNIMRVLRSIHHLDGLAYISTPITSGKYMYEQKYERLGRFQWTKETAKKIETEIKEKSFAYNYHEGYNFLENLEKRVSIPIIFPAELSPARQEWEQAHFQALWLSIISEMATEVHMNEDWEYSNGCSEEFVHTMQLRLGLPKHKSIAFYNTKETEENNRERMRNIKIYDYAGAVLSLEDGIHLIEKSVAWIRTAGFKTDKLDRCIIALAETSSLLEKGFYQ